MKTEVEIILTYSEKDHDGRTQEIGKIDLDLSSEGSARRGILKELAWGGNGARDGKLIKASLCLLNCASRRAARKITGDWFLACNGKLLF